MVEKVMLVETELFISGPRTFSFGRISSAPSRKVAEKTGFAVPNSLTNRISYPMPTTEAPKNVPRHIAIIMDGNGRWAKERGLPRTEGHRQGAETVRRVTERCGELGVEFLTLYAFSSENWKRPKREVDALMKLL